MSALFLSLFSSFPDELLLQMFAAIVNPMVGKHTSRCQIAHATPLHSDDRSDFPIPPACAG